MIAGTQGPSFNAPRVEATAKSGAVEQAVAQVRERRTLQGRAGATEAKERPAETWTVDPALQNRLNQLREYDRRAHAVEAAQLRRAGPHVIKSSFTYEIGPDGKRYALNTSVELDVAPVPGDPQSTLAKMQMVAAAAMAALPPSASDYRAAIEARSIRLRAEQELALARLKDEMEKGLTTY